MNTGLISKIATTNPLCIVGATKSKDVQEVNRLIASGVDVDSEVGGWTALTLAGHGGLQEIACALLCAGADTNIRAFNGDTALHGAASWGHKEIIKQLLAAGADVEARGANGCTPLMLAAAYAVDGHQEVVSLLLSAGAEVNQQDDMGRTALELAASEGTKTHCEIIELLLNAGADVHLKNEDGLTAGLMARCLGHREIAERLWSENVDPAVVRDTLEYARVHAQSAVMLQSAMQAMMTRG